MGAPPDSEPPDGGLSARGLLRLSFWSGPGLALLAFICATQGIAPVGWQPEALIVAGTAVWMAIWWITEPVPIGATSLLPLLIFPLTGVAKVKVVAAPYMHPFIVLLMAGFMAALAIERWGLHRRVAVGILLRVGTSPTRLVLGMMIACAVCSMWISNTATTLMMLPIALALVDQAESQAAPSERAGVAAFALALFLGIAYASSIGGLGTPIGTPPNLIFLGVYESSFPELAPITFAGWVARALPLVVLAVPLIWLYLVRWASPVPSHLPVGGRDVLEQARAALGRPTADEKAVGSVFLGMALLWITRRIRVGDGELVGWAPALGIDSFVNDATVAVAGALLLFAWPSRTRPGQKLLDWPTASRIPWQVVLLFGGGVALAEAFQVSGLSEQVALGLAGLGGLATPLMVAAIALTVTFLTEVTSNTATTTILMPVLAAFAHAAGLPPEQVMLPAVLSASCAFMLPVATAPNAIVYGSGRVPIAKMARVGLALNLGGAALITAWITLTV